MFGLKILSQKSIKLLIFPFSHMEVLFAITMNQNKFKKQTTTTTTTKFKKKKKKKKKISNCKSHKLTGKKCHFQFNKLV